MTIDISTLEMISSFISAGATSSSVRTPTASLVMKLIGMPTALIRIG